MDRVAPASDFGFYLGWGVLFCSFERRTPDFASTFQTRVTDRNTAVLAATRARSERLVHRTARTPQTRATACRVGVVSGEHVQSPQTTRQNHSCCPRADRLVVRYAFRIFAQSLELDHLAPHDLRRTCAKHCNVNGGELEQIQCLRSHASVLTTERYLGCKQNLEEPVNGRFGCLLSISLDSR